MTWATAWGCVWRGRVGGRRGKASFTVLLSAQKTGQAESREEALSVSASGVSMAQQPRVNPELRLTLCPRAQKGLSEASGFHPRACVLGQEAGRQGGLARVSAVRWGCSPDSSTPQRLPVLSATRSDCLGVVHLCCVPAPSPCARRFSLGTWTEAIVSHSLILPPALCPAAFRLNAGKPQAPLGHPGTPATQREALPLPGAGAGAGGGNQQCLLPPHAGARPALRAGPEDSLLRGMLRAGWLPGPLRLPHRGQSCQKDAEVSS